MKIDLAYDRGTISVEVPDGNIVKVLRMQQLAPPADEVQAVTDALRSPVGTAPLKEAAAGKKNACIVISDYTRPVPNKKILPALFAELNAAGIADKDITILVACGIHAPSEGAVLEEMVGKDIMNNYRIVNHFSQKDDELVHFGETSRGTPISVNKLYYESDFKILTGLIEPHFMAGFSGGRKSICPGVCSLETMKVMHGPAIMEHPKSSNGVIEGNPFHEEAVEIARKAGVDFICNVVIDETRAIGGVFAGDLEEAHAAGVAYCRGHVSDTVAEKMDIVVTSNAGYPLDSNYYQTVKGMVTATDILKDGGTIVMASACSDGAGSDEFREILETTDDAQAFVKTIQEPGHDFITDQWEVEELAKALRRAEVLLYTTGLTKEQVADYLVTPVDSVEQGIAMALKKHGPDAKIAVIPGGPYVMGRVAG